MGVVFLALMTCAGLFVSGHTALADPPLVLTNTMENIAEAGGAYAPAITSSAPDPTNLASMPIVVHWGGVMTGFDETDLVLGNATMANFKTGTELYSYKFGLLPSSNGLVTVDIPAAVAVDESQRDNLAAAQFSRTYDAINPAEAKIPKVPQTAFKSLQTGRLMHIPFTHWQTSQDIYVINTDGTGLTALTSTPENECYPTWSPDGSKIAFARRKGGHFVISVMNADGSNVRDLFEPDLTRSIEHVECTPAWSPDGAYIAFTSSRDGNLEVYVMNADGSNPRNLTNNPAADGFPAWSPDGAEIAFTSDRDGHMQTYACGLDGANVRRLTDDPKADEFAPSWSPDGKQILIAAKNTKQKVQTEMVDVGRPRSKKITVGPKNACFASWARDGRHVALTLPKRNPKGIDILDVQTQKLVPVVPSQEELDLVKTQKQDRTDILRSYGGAQWSPDGTKLLFASMSATIRPGPPGPDFEWPFRWLYLGAHGELFTPGRLISPEKNELRIEPQDGGFALVHTGPKWSGTYAIVRPDCKIILIAPVPKEVDRSSMAQFWPYKDETGHPIAPPYGAVIAAKHAVSPPNIVRPEGTLGWFFLCADGEYYYPDPELPIHANAFWVVRKDNELQWVRTGPVSKGEIYATIGLDRKIVFAPGVYQGPQLRWDYIEESGRPTFNLSRDTVCKGMPREYWMKPNTVILHPDGSETASIPGIP